jgi:hypothetical protein
MMKIFIKNLFILGVFSLTLFNSCKKDDPVDPCEQLECFNGGTCVNGTCDCPAGFTGDNCEIQVDPCANVTCLNGGTCVNGSCDCPTGYTGPDCGNQETPSKIRITNIRVTKFPATDNGAGWDLSSGPDIYVSMEYSASQIYEHPTFFQNANPTQDYDFQPNINLNMNNPTDIYIIRLYDNDDFGADDFMGGIQFVPYQDGNNFPNKLNLDAGGDVAFELTVVYTF